MRLYDAHNHLQDERLAGIRDAAVADTLKVRLRYMVVNGSAPKDWPEVADLARKYPCVIPSFGVHPWYVKSLPSDWLTQLETSLNNQTSPIGEIGLDRWIEGYDLPLQEEVFRPQLRLACERELPVTIHCLKAWGRLHEILCEDALPRTGFLLHSYGGPVEMVKPLADLGAYFSLSGYFAHPRKARQAETFRHIPAERLLVETDAPDMWPPEDWNEFPHSDPATGGPANHPANIRAVYRFLAELRSEPIEQLAAQVEENFLRLFGKVLPPPGA